MIYYAVMAVGAVFALACLSVWVWAVGEPFTFPRRVWDETGFSRAVTVTMCALVPLGGFAYAMFVRPHIVRADRALRRGVGGAPPTRERALSG